MPAEKLNNPTQNEYQDLKGQWDVSFDPKWGGPRDVHFSELVSWTTKQDIGIKYYSGTAIYRKTFDIEKSLKVFNAYSKIILDLGNVKNVAEVSLNGKNLGVLWCEPWQFDITKIIKEKQNDLEIRVTNLWANRVIYDLSLPIENRITKTHKAFRFDMLSTTSPILDSGLLGPVKILLI